MFFAKSEVGIGKSDALISEFRPPNSDLSPIRFPLKAAMVALIALALFSPTAGAVEFHDSIATK